MSRRILDSDGKPLLSYSIFYQQRRRADRLVCKCGKVAKVVDTGKVFYVRCPCKRKSSDASTEKEAIAQWETDNK